MPQDKIKTCLASDNYTSAHPLVIESITRANDGWAQSYGEDILTQQAESLIKQSFTKPCKLFFVPTGSGSNVLALKLALRRHESVICSDIAHINYQESGASESIIGCKLLTVPHKSGKVTPDALMKKVHSERMFGKHSTSPRVLSITQPTEFGTVYTLAELQELSRICKQEHLLLHIDGSRIYNAVVSLNTTLDEMAKVSQVDILSLGGTKNGLMCAEALVIFNPALEEGSDHIHKQTLQLVSKMRYISAQFIPFFTNNLWRKLASAANQQAQEIARILKNTPNCTLSYPVETNQIFFKVPNSYVPIIQEHIACYIWDKDDEKSEIRFVTSWNTSDEDVKKVAEIIG